MKLSKIVLCIKFIKHVKEFFQSIAFHIIFRLPLYQTMKKYKATYLSIFLLLSFVSSFGVNTYLTANSSHIKFYVSKTSSTKVSTKEEENSSSTDLVFDENELDANKKNLSVEDYFTFSSLIKNFVCFTKCNLILSMTKCSFCHHYTDLYIIFNVFRI